MAERAVRAVRKNATGDITALCNEGEPWSPRSKADAIQDIETSAHQYYVPWTDGRTMIRVFVGTGGKYLRTDKDSTPRNNLEELPDC